MGSKWGRGQAASNAVEFFKIASSEFFLSRFEKSAFRKFQSPVDFFLFDFFGLFLDAHLEIRPKNTCAKFGGEIRNNEAATTRKHPLWQFFIRILCSLSHSNRNTRFAKLEWHMPVACWGYFVAPLRAPSAPGAALLNTPIWGVAPRSAPTIDAMRPVHPTIVPVLLLLHISHKESAARRGRR